MNVSAQLAKHVREVYFGGNWTSVNYRDTLSGVTYEQATRKVGDFNTIATLVFHTRYYIPVVKKVLGGGLLEGKDSLSFEHPPIDSGDAWQALLEDTWREAELFAKEIEALPDERLGEFFTNEKYGTYHRNLLGFIEHLHYHLGQIVILKKLVTAA